MAEYFGLVQARMGSSRLPGKVLASVCGKPLIWHIADRLGHASRLSGVVVATADTMDCDPIRDVASAHDIQCFSGPEADLVARLLGASRSVGADAIVRVTADCPLVDPVLVDELIDVFEAARPEMDCALNYLPRRYPHGLDLEVYPLQLLERLDRELTDPYDREWFPPYVSTRPGLFRIATLTSPEDLSALRWTVDYPEDLEFCRAIYERLWVPRGCFGTTEVLELLSREPALGEINRMHAAH